MITHDRWQRIKEIFQSAQEKQPAERKNFLDEICGDDVSLREEVEALLTADASNDDDHFLDTPAFEIGAGLIVGNTSEPVEFSAGQKVDRYTIVRLLGAGGMGQIYLAQDEQMGRKIALKFIAREFATNPRRVLRFEQEALAVSSLNHPNVCVIHETGVTESNRRFIAMEYIEGITLRDKLARQTVAPLEALQIAIQVAAALASAHAAGIVHRDIKPENIMLRPDGYVKVLDFGLAKLTERVSQTHHQVSSHIHTEAGTLMGTVKYMSPEQLREFELDERTDVWSLGVVLYEMLTGKTPFESRIPNDSIVMILGPQPVTLALPDHLSVRFREIIGKALEKDRAERYETTRQFAADLKALHKDLERQADVSVDVAQNRWYPPLVNTEEAHQLTAGSAIFERLKSQAFLTAEFIFSEIKTHRTAAALFTCTGVLAFLLFLPDLLIRVDRLLTAPVAKPSVGVNLTPFTNSGTSVLAALSPDGKFVAHVEEEYGKQHVLVSSNPAVGTAFMAVQPEEARYLGVTFSQDNNYLYLTRKEKDGRSVLYRVPRPGATGAGALVVGIKENVDSPISLSPKGDQFAFVRFNRELTQYSVVVSDFYGGNERVLTTREGDRTFSTFGLSWSPDGSTIVCPESFWSKSFHTQLIAVDVKTGNERVLGQKEWFLVYQVAFQPDMGGVIICARERETTPFQIWRVSFPEGSVEKVTNDLNEYKGISVGGGDMVTVQTNRSWRIWIARSDGSESPVSIASGVGFTYGMSWSVNNYIVYASMAQDRMNISRIAPDGRHSLPLTNAGINYNPVVSSDGRFIVFSTDLDGSFNIWRMNEDGGGLKQLTFTDANYYPSISPDGKWVAFDKLTGAKTSIWKVPFEGGEPVKVIDRYRMPVFSPDGSLIAARFDEDSGSRAVAIFSSDGGEALQHVPVPIVEWQTIRWLDDHTLSYIKSVNGASNLWTYDLKTKLTKQITFFDDNQIVAYAWSPDFKDVACQRATNFSDVTIISSER